MEIRSCARAALPILMTLACVQLSARALPQISLSGTNMKLSEVFTAIQKQSGYSFFYKDKLVENIRVSPELHNVELDQALKQVLRGLPLSYTIVGHTVVINRAEPAATAASGLKPLPSNLSSLTGSLTDTLGVPIVGANISLEGTKFFTLTDNKGIFTFNNVPAGKYLLVVTHIGYAKLVRTVVADAGPASLHLVMHIASSPLDQVQIVAYGNTIRRFNVGSVATVTSEEIERQPVENPLLALEGLVPGLVITPTSGNPGAAIQVQIRGQNSIQSNLNAYFNPYDQPLFIVDGVPFAPQNANINVLQSLAGTSDYNFYGGVSPFNSINPADIESISVLKDADATSIYGTQGANGVILITTKKGKPGPTKLDAVVNSGVNVITRQVQMLNTQQYLALRNEALNNDGISLAGANPAQYPDLLVFSPTKYTDWFHQYEGKASNNTDVHVSVSGGSPATTFIVSGGFTRATFNFPGDFADNRLTLHSAFHHSAMNNRLTIDFGYDYAYDRNNSSAAPNITNAILTPPNYPDLLDPHGNLVWNYEGVSLSRFQNYSHLKQPSLLQSYDANNVLRIGYQITPGLQFSVNLGYNHFNSNEAQQFPMSSMDPTRFTPMSYAMFATNTYETINVEPQLDYKHNFGKGQLTALIGGTYKKNTNDNTQLSGYGYTDDALLGSISGASTITANEAGYIYKYVAAFGRIGYIYDQEYIVSLTGRRDGSSNFGPGRQFGNFGSAGLGWIFSTEKAVKSALPFISFGKLSATYGTNGSDAISPYLYQAFWQPVNIPGVEPFQGTRPYVPLNLYNPDYSWDTKRSFNFALDLGFWNNRLLMNATWYQNRVGDQLTDYTLPSQTGFNSVLENFSATVQNRGLEFTLNSDNIISRNFKWTTNFNLSGHTNKLVAFPGLANSSYATLYTVGKSVNEVMGFRYKDVNPQTGVFEFYTAKGAVTYNPNYGPASQGGDFEPIADLDPRFTGALANTVTYKKLSLFFTFQFTKQTGLNYLYSIYPQANNPGGFSNEPAAVLSRWQKPGDITDVERATASFSSAASAAGGYFGFSSGAYSDASYIRLKTLALSYSLPAAFLKKMDIKNGKFYLNAQNLLLITKYKVGDPELAGQLFSLPLQRTIVGGLSLNF
ncbi:MAG TPA: SusC/RagA family TonB-linked outer membrane protein [Puia sp.]|jgi:TonB-linked SusC/RagA family outer membrane protein|nr:SusC/RagA family TonB-linked outer membrane protein [Puia sp.]